MHGIAKALSLNLSLQMPDYFPIIIVEAKNEIPETLGTKEKFWIEHDKRSCLLKFGREGTGEDWAEKVACELCKLLDLPHAHYELAQHIDRTCILSMSFIDEDDRLILGNELTNTSKENINGARSYQQREHTVTRALAAILVSTEPDTKKFTLPQFSPNWHNFIGYLMLDAWIGNCDRHNENWGVIIGKDRVVHLAPTFDHASSLGRELPDETRTQRLMTKDSGYSVAAYAKKARSALYAEKTDKHPLSPIEAFAATARFQKTSAIIWQKKLRAIKPEAILSILERIPPDFMTQPAKDFAAALLNYNQAKILEL